VEVSAIIINKIGSIRNRFRRSISPFFEQLEEETEKSDEVGWMLDSGELSIDGAGVPGV